MYTQFFLVKDFVDSMQLLKICQTITVMTTSAGPSGCYWHVSFYVIQFLFSGKTPSLLPWVMWLKPRSSGGMADTVKELKSCQLPCTVCCPTDNMFLHIKQENSFMLHQCSMHRNNSLIGDGATQDLPWRAFILSSNHLLIYVVLLAKRAPQEHHFRWLRF